VRPSAESGLSKVYYKHLHSQYTDKLRSLSMIDHSIRLLQDQKRKFIVTAQDPLILESDWHSDSAISMLQDSVEPHVTWFDHQSFYHWAKQNNHAVSNNWHPLESAHQAAFEYIRDQRLV
jgi:hypothetical protein